MRQIIYYIVMRKFLTFILCLFVGLQAFADGKIQGTVIDSTTAESLIGVSVSVYKEGTDVPLSGSLTDIDGHYLFEVAAGTYEVEVKYLGYATKRLTEIVVVNGKSTKVDISMSDKGASTELDEVVIQSSMKKETVNALYTLQKNAVAVSDGISADVIKKSPDRSTSDVLKRVSGTTIVDNKFVIVRGLSDRYNSAMVDDAPLPSTEPNRKAFSFDIIPANMIDNIIITKAGTPDLPGDFAGGVINILTKEVPEDNFTNFSIGTGFNTVSTFKTFKSGYRSPTDFLGFDNGERQLHPQFPTTAGVAKISGSKYPEHNSVNFLKALNNDFAIREHSALPAINLQASLGRLYSLSHNRRFGVTAAVTYSHSENIKPNLLRQYDDYNYQDVVNNYSTNIGGLLNFGYYVGKSKFNLKTFYNRTFDDNFLFRQGTNIGSSNDVNYYAYDLVQKSLFKTSLDGSHQIGNKDAKIDWIASYNYITNNQPDQRKVSYTRTIGTTDPYAAQLGTLGKSNSRLFSDMGESVLNGVVNYTQPVKMFKKSSLKIGAFGQYRHRNFENRYLGMVMNEMKPGYDAIERRPVATLFANDAIDGEYYSLQDQTITGDNYTATSRTMGGYVMLDNKITEKFRAVYGVRFESYNVLLDADTVREVNKSWNDFLPSVNLTYAINDNVNIRGSYFRSLARPEFRELANLSYYDYEQSATVLGNPGLNRSLINNFDLRYEWFLGKGEIFSASAFYKKFDNTLENQVLVPSSSYEIRTRNYEKATVIGIEMEIRKNLGFIAPSSFLKNMNFYTNVAIIKSKATDTTVNYDPAGNAHTDRELSGQAPYTINSSLGYSAFDGKLNFNLLYNRIGQRLYLVGSPRLWNIYERPRNLLDFQVSYAVSKRSEFKFNAKDLINNNVTLYIDQDADSKFTGVVLKADGNIDPTKDMIFSQFKPGRSFSLTYSLKF